MSPAAIALCEQIAARLPAAAPGINAREMHAAVDCYSRTYIGQLLTALIAQGRAQSALYTVNPVIVERRYWRAVPAEMAP